MNYTELVAQLQDWIESSEADFVAAIDDIIINAEQRIYKAVDFAITRDEDASITLTQGDSLVTLPDNTITVRFVQYVDDESQVRTTLYQKDLSFIDEFTTARTIEALPRYYGVVNNATILVGPAPTNSVDTLRIHRTIRPAPISAINTTTWLADTYPELLLFSCLLEIGTYHKFEQDTMQDYQARYQEALQGTLVEENHRNRFDRARHGEIGITL